MSLLNDKYIVGILIIGLIIIIVATIFITNETFSSGVKNSYNLYYPYLGGQDGSKGLYYAHYFVQPHYYKDFQYYPYYYSINYKPEHLNGRWWGYFYPRNQRWVKPYYSWRWYQWWY